jgi:hypothetical protein
VFTTKQNLHHTIRTIYGDLNTGHLGTLWAVPYSGIGPGNGDGPGIWAVVSIPVLKIMKDEVFGCMYKTSIEGKDIHFVGYSFNNDTDIIQSVKTGKYMEGLACRM